MQPTTRAIKAQARAVLAKSSPRYWQVTLVFILLVTFLPNFIYEIFDASLLTLISQIVENPTNIQGSTLIGLFVTLVVTLISMVLQYGFALWALRCWRQEEENGFGSLLEGFGSVGRILLATLFVTLFVLCWTTLLSTAVSAIIFSLLSSSSIVGTLLLALYTVTIFVAVALIFLRYALVPYVLADRPDLSAFRCVTVSSLIMRGQLWRLLRLFLSFVGLFILSNLLSTGVSLLAVHLTVGIPSITALDYLQVMNLMSQPIPFWSSLIVDSLIALFLTPYISVSTAGFFDSLVRPNQQQNQQNQQSTHNSDIY